MDPVSKVLSWNGGPDERLEITGGKVQCDQFPFVVITSNSEREFPAPFLRRCIQLTIEDPKAYTKPWTTHIEFGLRPKWTLQEQFCEDEESFQKLDKDAAAPTK